MVLPIAIIGQPGGQCMPGSVISGHGAAANTGMTPMVIASTSATNLSKRLMQLNVSHENAVTKNRDQGHSCNGTGAITNLISPVLRVKIGTPIIQEMSRK
jgi:hypothetical protein